MLNRITNWFTVSRYIFIIIILILIALFSALSILELRMEEPRRALVALEMFFSGNYAVPTLNGEPYYNKPPLFNWMILILFKLFGSFDEWQVRLPSVLGFLGMGLVIFITVKKYISRHVAAISALMFLTTGDLFFYSTIHSGEIDLFYSFVVVCQIMSVFILYHRKKYLLMFLFSYFFMAAGCLTKGIPSIAFQGITLLAVAIYYKDIKLLFRWQHFIGLFLSFVLILGYFSWYKQYEDPLPFIIRLVSESSEKSVVEKLHFVSIIKNTLLFPFIIISKMLPWSLLILIPVFVRSRFKSIPKNPLISFIVLFILSNIIIYWLTPNVKIRYTFMFFPFFIILIAYYSHNYYDKLSEKKWFLIFLGILNVIVLAGIIVSPFLTITRELKTIKIVTPFIVILALFNLFYLKKFPERWFYSFVILLVLIRFEMNLTFLPLSHRLDYKHQEIIEKTLEITKGEKIFFAGEFKHYPKELTFGSINFIGAGKEQFTVPSFIHYKIPFYICREKESIMRFHEYPQKGNFYISTLDYYNNLKLPAIEYIRSLEKKNKYVLFKLKE